MADVQKIVAKIRDNPENPAFGEKDRAQLSSLFNNYFRRGKDSKPLKKEVGEEDFVLLEKQIKKENWDYFAVVPLLQVSEDEAAEIMVALFTNYILLNDPHNPKNPKYDKQLKNGLDDLIEVLSMITEYHICENYGPHSIAYICEDYYDLPKKASESFASCVISHKADLQRIYILKKLNDLLRKK